MSGITHLMLRLVPRATPNRLLGLFREFPTFIELQIPIEGDGSPHPPKPYAHIVHLSLRYLEIEAS